MLATYPVVAGASLTWSGAISLGSGTGGPPVDVTGVACPAISQCTAVTAGGHAATFNPAAPGTPSPIWIDSYITNVLGTNAVAAVSCPTAHQCTAVDASASEVTFDPIDPGTRTPVAVESNEQGGALSAVACPTSTQCTAVGAGWEATFRPSVPGASTSNAIDGSNNLTGVACPSVSQCSAVDDHGQEITFNPTAPGGATPIAIDSGHGLDAVACPSVSQCTGVDSSARAVTFNPTTPGTPAPKAVDGANHITAVACPSVSQCSAVDDHGQEITFNPTAPGGATPIAIDSGHGLDAVACPSASQCTAVDNSGHQKSFNPSSPGTSAPAVIVASDSQSSLSSVSCPSAHQCTVIGGPTDPVVQTTGETTFDPTAPESPTSTVSAILNTRENPTAVACPSVSQCTAVISGSQELTFDPNAPGTPAPVKIGDPQHPNALVAVACPSAHQCTAIDGASQFTFDPSTGHAMNSAFVDGNWNMTDLACPSTSQCTAVDASGREGTFDPAAKGIPPVTTIPGGGLSVACPSVSQCTTVAGYSGPTGPVVTFNPTAPGIVSAAGADRFATVGIGTTTAISCPSIRYCVAIDGSVFEGDPTSTASWKSEILAAVGVTPRVSCIPPGACYSVDQFGLAGIACVSSTQLCVAVDRAGDAFIGSGPGGWPSRPPAPTITVASVTNRRFRVAPQATVISATARNPAPLGTRFRFTLSAMANLKIAITRSAPGIRRGNRCVAPTAKLGPTHANRCMRALKLGTLTRSSEPARAGSVAFSGRIGHLALRPGAYSAVLVASNAGGRSKPVTLPFTVVR